MLAALVGLAGLCVGSLLNVIVLRTRAGRSFVSDRSACPSCDVTIAAYDLVPLVSFVVLSGRCRACAAPISVQYPLVECLTGVLFFLAFLVRGPTWLFARDILFFLPLLLVFLYDLRYMEIPDRFTVPAMMVAFGMNLWLGVALQTLLVGALAAGGFFLLQFLFSRGRWIGSGDIRLGVVMGLMLGLANSVAALFVSYLLGAAFGLFLIAMRRADGKTAVPFGTFLSAATVIVLLWGEPIVAWYLGFIGFAA